MSPMSPVCNTYKVVLLGSGGVGKTAFLHRLINGKFEPRYLSTQGTKNVSLSINTNHGRITFDITDTAGQEIYFGGSLVPNALNSADAVIIMYDMTSRVTLRQVDQWRALVAKCGNNPYILTVGNKCDIESYKTQRERNAIRISARTGQNLDKVFLNVAMNLLNEPTLQLI